MKKRIFGSVAVFISIAIIFIVVTIMYGGTVKTSETYSYDPTSFYKPQINAANTTNPVDEVSVYNELAGYTLSGNKNCITDPSRSSSLVKVESGSVRADYLFIDNTILTGDPTAPEDSAYHTIQNLDSSTLKISEYEYYYIGDYDIIAPFYGSFITKNISGNNIYYENFGEGSSKLRMEILDAANWFCSGPPPTDAAEKTKWYGHYHNHDAIIGKSANTKCSSAEAGDIIAYGNEGTKIRFYAYKDGQWVSISIEEFYNYNG